MVGCRAVILDQDIHLMTQGHKIVWHPQSTLGHFGPLKFLVAHRRWLYLSIASLSRDDDSGTNYSILRTNSRNTSSTELPSFLNFFIFNTSRRDECLSLYDSVKKNFVNPFKLGPRLTIPCYIIVLDECVTFKVCLNSVSRFSSDTSG